MEVSHAACTSSMLSRYLVMRTLHPSSCELNVGASQAQRFPVLQDTIANKCFGALRGVLAPIVYFCKQRIGFLSWLPSAERVLGIAIATIQLGTLALALGGLYMTHSTHSVFFWIAPTCATLFFFEGLFIAPLPDLDYRAAGRCGPFSAGGAATYSGTLPSFLASILAYFGILLPTTVQQQQQQDGQCSSTSSVSTPDSSKTSLMSLVRSSTTT